MDTYREAEGGGYHVVKAGAVVGYVPPGHPMVEQIAALAKRKAVIVQPAQPPDPPPPAREDQPSIGRLIAVLIRRGVISQQDLDEAREG